MRARRRVPLDRSHMDQATALRAPGLFADAMRRWLSPPERHHRHAPTPDDAGLVYRCCSSTTRTGIHRPPRVAVWAPPAIAGVGARNPPERGRKGQAGRTLGLTAYYVDAIRWPRRWRPR